MEPALMSEIDLVIFDCDGVLIDSELISARMLVAELAGQDVHVDLPYVAHHFLGRSYPVVISQIRKEFGLELPPEFEVEYRARLLAAFDTELQEMPGVRAVIEALDVPCCVATSSSPPRVERALEIVDMAGLFGANIFTASEVRNGKPAPDLFLHAAARMQVPRERCLVIEDSFNGIRSGLAAGMEVWHFTGGSHMAGVALDGPDLPVPQRRFASFDEFFQPAPHLRKADPAA